MQNQNQKWIRANGKDKEGKEWLVEVRLYSSLEAADYCGGPDNRVSTQTINRWRELHWLRSIPIGRGHLYTKESLDQCLKARKLENRIHND